MSDLAAQTVLVVDDCPDLLRAVANALRRGGYSPMVASGPMEALRQARAFPGAIDLLLSDVSMPEMDGIALAEQMVAERRNIRVVLMSASTVRSRWPVLEKPFPIELMLRHVASAIGGSPACVPAAGPQA